MSLISAKNLSVERDGQTVLRGINLAIEAGEIVTVVGPNGSGKTTLLRALIGALPLATGQVDQMPGLRLGRFKKRDTVIGKVTSTASFCGT